MAALGPEGCLWWWHVSAVTSKASCRLPDMTFRITWSTWRSRGPRRTASCVRPTPATCIATLVASASLHSTKHPPPRFTDASRKYYLSALSACWTFLSFEKTNSWQKAFEAVFAYFLTQPFIFYNWSMIYAFTIFRRILSFFTCSEHSCHPNPVSSTSVNMLCLKFFEFQENFFWLQSTFGHIFFVNSDLNCTFQEHKNIYVFISAFVILMVLVGAYKP